MPPPPKPAQRTGFSDAFQSSSAISHTLCLNTLVDFLPVNRNSFRGNNAKLHLLAAYAQHLHAVVVVDADDFAYAAGEYNMVLLLVGGFPAATDAVAVLKMFVLAPWISGIGLTRKLMLSLSGQLLPKRF